MRRLFLKLCASAAGATWLSGAQSESGQSKQLTADDLKKLLESGRKLFYLDVREPKELKDLGTIKGYVNIPLSQLEKRIGEIPKEAVVVTL
ncbi:MAG: hypothetical protein R2762_04875 [Bryobacteraceae bacterium]